MHLNLHDQLKFRPFVKTKENKYGTVETKYQKNWESREKGVAQHQCRKSGLHPALYFIKPTIYFLIKHQGVNSPTID